MMADDKLYLLRISGDKSALFNQLKEYFVERYEADQHVDLSEFEALYRKCNPYGNIRSHLDRGYIDFCLEKTYTNYSIGIGTFNLINKDTMGRKLSLSSVSYFGQAKFTLPVSLNSFYSLEARYYYLPDFASDQIVDKTYEVSAFAKVSALKQSRFKGSAFSYRIGAVVTMLPIPTDNSLDLLVTNAQIEMESLNYAGVSLGLRYVPERNEGVRHAFTFDYIPSFRLDTKIKGVSEIHFSYDYFPSSLYSLFLFSDMIEIDGNDDNKISISSIAAGVKLYLF